MMTISLTKSQQVGGSRQPLFAFSLNSIGPRRRRRNVVERAQFRAELRQLREPVPGDDIGAALSEALHAAIERELRREVRHQNDFVNFSLTAHGFTHAYQSINFTVGEFLERSVRLNELLQELAGKLNSNESFDPEQGFQVEVVFVRRPQPGSGRGKKRNTGRRCLDNENKKKRCIIPIKNNDVLCCARATVTMRAHAHKDDTNDAYHDYRNIIQGRAIQEHQARELHHLAGVDPGPCGLEELEKFQAYLRPTYQLLVVCRTKPFFLIFKGPPAPKQIKLLKSDTHYDGCTSFPAFVNRSYWCSRCEKGFNVDDAKNHPCEGRTCQACNRKTCSDYNRDVSPTLVCPNCHCRFYGIDCFDYHREKINAPNTELVPSVMQNTMSSRASDINAGFPPAQAVKKWSRSTHTNVLFTRPWTTQKKMLMMMIMVRKNPSLHPSLYMPTLRLCSCRTDNLKPTCCVTGPAKARRSLPTRERTVSAPSYMISTMQPRFPTMTVREPSSSSFTISKVLTECLL